MRKHDAVPPASAPPATGTAAPCCASRTRPAERPSINSPLATEVFARGGEVLCKPWVSRNPKGFRKSDFTINMRARTITRPAGKTERFTLGQVVEFDPRACVRCPMRAECTSASRGRGRTIAIAHDEPLQHRLRKLVASSAGRERLRERVKVEHALAHLSRKQGRRARYTGIRKNVFDLRRHAAVVNLETIHRHHAAAAA